MANPENASLWGEADVFIAPLGTTLPSGIDEDFPAAWSQVGLLDGEDGFAETREQETSDSYGWGGILIRSSRRNFKLTRKFSVLEDNETTRGLIWPGSPEGSIVVPKPEPILIGFETRDGTKKRRVITDNYAEVDVDGDITENETDLAKVPLIATIYPSGDGTLFIEQKTA